MIMLNKRCFLVFIFLISTITSGYSQCSFGGTNSGTIVTPTSTDQFTGNLRGGRYFTMNVVSGGLYTISTVGLASWDTQLTVHDTSGNLIDFNDDFGSSLQSELTFISSFSGQVRVLLTEFSCQSTNGSKTSQVRYNGSSSYLTINDILVAEEDGSATFTVTYNGAATSAFNVDYSTSDGTAEDVFDYSAISGTLSFTGAVGETRTVAVTLVDNTFGESTEEFFLALSNATNGVDIANFGTATITDTDPAIPQDVPLALYDDLSGNFDYTVAGGTFRTQSNTTNACAITTTSSGSVTSTIPAGAVIKRAYLYWAHSNNNPDDIVTFEGQSVQADVIYGASFTTRQFYGYISDVTSIVDGITNPTSNVYDVTDLNIDNGGDFCASATVLGAWSLMIFYEEVSLPAATLNLYYGFDISQNAGTSFTLDNFFAISPAGSKATFLSYEGDATLDGSSSGSTNPEELSITNQLGLTNILSGDGGQTGNNAYNSTIYDGLSGVNSSNIYGLDLDTYDISSYIVSTDTQVTANVDVGQDLVISSAVLLRVPSNLISGTVFEDINYPGGNGRSLADAGGIGLEDAIVELYNSVGTLIETNTTDASGNYSFGGMADGSYTVRVVNSSVRSSRGGGLGCTTCYAVQTFKTAYDGITTDEITDEVGGANPAIEDSAAGTLSAAQTVSSIVIASGGIGNIDFGFNFNAIVNTNEDGQGSLEQFIVNSNNLDETGLDIDANVIFDPAPGIDTSVFMIPPTSDPQGRPADVNYNGSYFDIFVANANPFSNITADKTSIDGRTQTAYSGNTNTGTIGSGGTSVGTSGIILPDYNLPEIQVHRNGGDVFRTSGDNVTIRNLSVYANNNAAIRINGGSAQILENLLGVNALGNNAGSIDFGVENQAGDILVGRNYIATVTDAGVYINGGSSNVIEDNHFLSNGATACDDSIEINSGVGIVIQNNLIENSASMGIDAVNISGDVSILNNTITGSGQNGGACSGTVQNYGVRLSGNDSQISNNIIFDNGGAGLVMVGNPGENGNLISQNSFYNNGTDGAALGIDLVASGTVADGVTINDLNDSDTGPNDLINFPIIETANINSTSIIVTGWSIPGATIEFFLTDISEGTAVAGANQLGLSTDYGEGQVFVGSFVEGSGADTNSKTSSYLDLDNNTDNTNQFTFTFSIPLGVTPGKDITATATVANSTSEFSPMSTLKTFTVITNRRITYRIKKN